MTTAFNWSDYITDRIAESFDLPTTAIDLPKEAIEEALKKVLHASELSLKASDPSLCSQAEAAQLIASNPSTSIFFPTLGSSISCVLSENALRTLFSWLLRKTLSSDESIAPDLARAIQQVLAAQVLDAAVKAGFAPAQGALIQESAPPTEGGSLHLITCCIDETEVPLQLFAPYSLLAKLEKKQIAPTPEQLRSWKSPLALEVGSVDLNLSELKNLAHGDCLLLDRCTLDPTTYHGTMTFTLHGKALFRAKLKGNECKLLDYPFDAIGATPMDDANPNEMNPNEQTPPPAGESPWLEGETDVPTPPPEANAEPVEQAQTTLSADQVPLEVKVELGHIEMSAARLTELAPGQVIDLGIRPEQGVECTVGGKRVARGLLVKIGEMIGVRITEIK